MIATTQELLKAISRCLENDVLPALEPASWPAGNLRGCLMLLTYLEDRVSLEGPTLVADNKALRGLLHEVATGTDMPRLDAELKGRIDTLLKEYPAKEAFLEIADLARENEAYLTVMTALIRQSFERRTETEAGQFGNLRAKVDACLAQLHARDYAMVERAQGMVPV